MATETPHSASGKLVATQARGIKVPRIFENIEQSLLPALRQTLELAVRGDFCAGYFNLRGWKAIDDLIERWSGGSGRQCRLLIGMQRLPQDELAAAFSLTESQGQLDNQAARDLADLRRYRVVLIDESQNLRNRDGKRYRAIQEYIHKNESKCILLSATPYNKTYGDLSNQLRLFVPEDKELGIRPERLLKDLGETEFIRRHQCPVRSLSAFEKSEYADDWRELMRLGES
jgi:hypothetical protein